jgi:hypothetical protein
MLRRDSERSSISVILLLLLLLLLLLVRIEHASLVYKSSNIGRQSLNLRENQFNNQTKNLDQKNIT